MRRNNSAAALAKAKARRAKMLDLVGEGLTLAQIGRRYGGISRQRVAQLVKQALIEAMT